MEQLIVFLATILLLVVVTVYSAYLSQMKDENDAIQARILNKDKPIGRTEGSVAFDEWMGKGDTYLAKNLPDEFVNSPYEILFGAKDSRQKLIEDNGGLNKLMGEIEKEVVHTDDFGELFKVFYERGDRYYYFVKVINGTPEPDGNYTEYFLEVPPDMETAKEAVAWTYGLHPDDYNLIIRT